MFYLYLMKDNRVKRPQKNNETGISQSWKGKLFSPLYNFNYSNLANASFELQIIFKNLCLKAREFSGKCVYCIF